MTRKWVTLLSLVGSLCVGTATTAQPITAYTAVLPPFTLGTEKEMPGISHEILTEMANRADVKISIEYVPWKRAQVFVQETPNTLLFTAGRSTAREPLYHWVTEFLTTDEIFATTSAPVNSIDEARQLSQIAVLDGSPKQKQLSALGLTNIYSATTTSAAARLLGSNRVDAWYTFDHRVLHAMKAEGLDPKSVTIGAPIQTSSLWLAAHLEFDKEVSETLTNALREMRMDGSYEAIVSKYLN
ncbi:substrate-binding periplasmic protein [Epibacterium ulvae]|uniref:substrate-binding periplasmic protein n=1 Tax=Epibacterium ulvae TaxID=1156985 RepID=UPI0024934174|nr:transporter substrate-binding domain-containing protein [Epibacterium ulvae]